MELTNSRDPNDLRVTAPDLGWPRLFGPNGNSTIVGRGLDLKWDSQGPRQLWRREVGSGYSSPVVHADQVVILQRLGDEECIECISATTGESRWQHRYSTSFVCNLGYSNGPYSTPIIEGNWVYALGAEGKLTAVNFDNGNKVWQRDLCNEFSAPMGQFPIGTSPLLEGDMLIVAIGGRIANSGIVALDRHSGKTVWCATNDARGYGTPIAATIHGQRHVFALTQESLVSLDPGAGNVRWQIPFRPKNPDTIVATTPVVWQDLLFVSAYQAGAMTIRVLPDGTPKTVWDNRRALDCQHNNLTCCDGNVFGFSAKDNSLHCVDLLTGKSIWNWKSTVNRGSIVSIDGNFLIWGESGNLVALLSSLKGCDTLAFSTRLLEPPCYSAPALSDGRLFLRNDAELACFDLRATAR